MPDSYSPPMLIFSTMHFCILYSVFRSSTVIVPGPFLPTFVTEMDICPASSTSAKDAIVCSSRVRPRDDELNPFLANVSLWSCQCLEEYLCEQLP